MLTTRFKCTICDYSTNRKSSYDAHKKTIKHINNANSEMASCNALILHNPIQTTNINNNSEPGLFTYLLKVQEMHDDMIKEHFNLMKEQLKVKDKQINEKDKQINKSMNLLKYLIANYHDAPVLSEITEYPLLEPDKLMTREDIIELIVDYYKNGTLINVLTEEIAKMYKTKEPRKQSVWTSDASRNNYIVKKNKIDDNTSEWIRDAGGVNVRDTIIKPYLEHLSEELKWYHLTYTMPDKLQEKGILRKIEIMHDILMIKDDINKKKIEDCIVKKLTFEFRFPKELLN
jgi:hypothetical protein